MKAIAKDKAARKKEWDFQRAGHTQSDGDDLAGTFGKMRI
jgi:hypothetical protein